MPITTSPPRRVFTSTADLAPVPFAPTSPPTWMILAHLWVPPLILPAFTSLISLESHRNVDPLALIAYTAGALAVYIGDRLLEVDDPTSACAMIGRWIAPLAGLSCCAAILCLGAIIADWPNTGPVSVALAMTSGAYAWLRRIPLLKILLVAGAWTLALHGSANSDRWSSRDASIALIIAATTLLCDLKDRERDAERGLVTVVTLIGAVGARAIATGLLLIAASMALLTMDPLLAAVSAAQLVPAWMGRTARPVIGSLIVDSTLVVAAAVATAVAVVVPGIVHHST